jgi:type VI secretion system protein ImpL
LATKLQTDAKNVAEIKWDRRMEFQPNLTTLHNLREDIIMLENYQQDAPPMSLRFGLYEGTDFIDILRKIYLSRLNEIMVNPLKEEIEKNLKIHMDSPDAEWDSLYNTLKAYLMLSMPDKLDQKFLNEQVSLVWENYLSRVYGEQKGYETNKIARSQLSFYLSQLGKNNVESNFILKPDPEITRKTRAVLSKEPAVKNIYSQIKKTGREQISPLRLKDILPPESRDLLMTTYEIPGIFTEYGYDLYIKDAISKAGAITTSGDWVLGSIGQQDTASKEKRMKIVGELSQLYVNEYLGTWNKFIGSISVKPFNSMDDLVKGLNLFSTEHSSPIVLLIKKMTDNMQIEVDSYQKAKAAEAGKEIFDKVKRRIKTKIGLTKTKLDVKEEQEENPIEKEYFYLSRFSGKSAKADDKESGQEKYLETIRKLHEKLYTIALGDSAGKGIESFTRKLFTQDSLSSGSNELVDGIKRTNYIVDDLRSRSKDSIKKLFLTVFEQAGSFCIRATSERLNKLWEEKIYKSYKRDIAGRYPFSPHAGDDIPRSEVADFLMPESGVIWAFYDRELSPYLSQDDNNFVPKRWRNMEVPFTGDFLSFLKQAVILKDALFWKDKRTPKIKFWIRPHPPKSATIYISKTIFHINGQRLVYENGPEVWEPFSWPGDKLEQEGLAPSASLEITRGVAGYKTEENFEGEWSFFRLLDKAKPKTENKKFFKLRWDFQMEGEHIKVEADLKTESSKNPFIPGIFPKFSCPEQLAAL